MAFTINYTGSGRLHLFFLNLSNCTATPASTVYVHSGTNGGGNTNLTFDSSRFVLEKTGGGVVNCLYLNLSNCAGFPTLTWNDYLGTDGGGNTNWTFLTALAATFPRLAYNGKWIDLPHDVMSFQPDQPHTVTRTRTVNGQCDVLNYSVDDIMQFLWQGFANVRSVDAALKRHIRQWWQWAQKGNAWTIARDTTQTVLTTLAADASVGALTLTLTSTVGVVVGQLYILRNETDLTVVKVTAISGSTVTIEDQIDFDFLSGDRFRAEQYWPGRLLSNPHSPVIEHAPGQFDIDLQFQEDLNDL
jgi:hypothetical protein